MISQQTLKAVKIQRFLNSGYKTQFLGTPAENWTGDFLSWFPHDSIKYLNI
jgi:hypothetical protein